MNKIGRWQGAGLLATTLLGTSVFILPQMTYNIAQQGAMFSWLLLTLAIVPVTFVFSRLSAHYPHAAGPAFFVEKAFGPLAGKSIGFIFLLIIPLGVPAAILMTIQFVSSLFSLQGEQVLCAQLAMLVILYLLNYRGIQFSAKVQFIITLAVLAVVLLLFLLAINLQPGVKQTIIISNISLPPILTAMGIAFWSFLGIEAMTHLAQDFKNPKKDMLPAMLIGTSIVGLIYLACTLLVTWLPNNNIVNMVGIFDFLTETTWGNLVIGVLGIAGGISTTNVYTASATKLIASFANDGVLPSYLAQKNTMNVPIRALLTLLLIMACVIVVSFNKGKDLEHLIAWVNGVFVLVYFASMLAAFKLLSKKHHLFIILGCLFCCLLAWGLGFEMLYATLLLLLTLPILYLQSTIKRRKIKQI